ncbi:uncharacterized protein LOC105735483 [Apis florea]|uniref:uncharacterized protein LOC105735483 n=1 Tax=Apis florea TaxID=7463 RepID=UPI000629BCDD|nr:uncharacterized protein LOC105735483 [Apis florea]
MRIILYAFFVLHSFDASLRLVHATDEEGTTLAGVEKREEREEEEAEMDMEEVGMTEEVMDPKIKITDVPDVEETTEEFDPSWDKNKVIRDVAYYIRGHKFGDFDRRYYKRYEDAVSKPYEEFPKPALRSLHWEVHRYCDASFLECLRYLEGVIEQTALKRQDDTITAINEQKWVLPDNMQQILSVQKECLNAMERDKKVMPPFEGPIERFQWRTTVSYYMCWYTMLGVPELSIFGEPCDNHANCEIRPTGDPRADDTEPYACALYSFCPDHCCPMKRIGDMTDCHQSEANPCYAGNEPGNRECKLDREKNQDFLSLVGNQINISCQCGEPGYEWSARFGLCVDVNECASGEHRCSVEDGETCWNMAGGYECVCKFGYTYDQEKRECVVSPEVALVLAGWKEEENVTEEKNIIEMIVKTLARAAANRPVIDRSILFTVMVVPRLFFVPRNSQG